MMGEIDKTHPPFTDQLFNDASSQCFVDHGIPGRGPTSKGAMNETVGADFFLEFFLEFRMGGQQRLEIDDLLFEVFRQIFLKGKVDGRFRHGASFLKMSVSLSMARTNFIREASSEQPRISPMSPKLKSSYCRITMISLSPSESCSRACASWSRLSFASATLPGDLPVSARPAPISNHDPLSFFTGRISLSALRQSAF